MTALKQSNLHMGWKTAGRSFVAKCGHRVEKGERYHVFDDYFGYTKYHISQCENCANNGKET